MQQPFIDSFMDLNQYFAVLIILNNSCEASFEDGEPTLQLKLINRYCSDELRFKFEEDDLISACNCLLNDKYLNSNRSLLEKIYISEQVSHLWRKTNLNQLKDENLTSAPAPNVKIITSDLKSCLTLVSC
jgi:hypothetical protein